jgi:hypothetical protein
MFEFPEHLPSKGGASQGNGFSELMQDSLAEPVPETGWFDCLYRLVYERRQLGDSRGEMTTHLPMLWSGIVYSVKEETNS